MLGCCLLVAELLLLECLLIRLCSNSCQCFTVSLAGMQLGSHLLSNLHTQLQHIDGQGVLTRHLLEEQQLLHVDVC